MNNFTSAEQLIILETARVALADAEIYDFIAEDLDISDESLMSIRDKIILYLDKEMCV